uniref:Uncharacterized protein n=1 Tax=Anguilla anguilla TaxID=7936 RepID=A0A0E9QNZ8_ANGAN
MRGILGGKKRKRKEDTLFFFFSRTYSSHTFAGRC